MYEASRAEGLVDELVEEQSKPRSSLPRTFVPFKIIVYANPVKLQLGRLRLDRTIVWYPTDPTAGYNMSRPATAPQPSPEDIRNQIEIVIQTRFKSCYAKIETFDDM
jgi:hypothetical protein